MTTSEGSAPLGEKNPAGSESGAASGTAAPDAAAAAAASAPSAIPSIPDHELDAVAEGRHSGPHGILGQHLAGGASGKRVVVRVRRPLAQTVTVVLSTGARVPLEHLRAGIWQGVHDHGLDDYRVETVYGDGVPHLSDDPYRFLPTIGDMDVYLLGEGRHERIWEALGAHVREHWGTEAAVPGVSFSVWAPHARAVRVSASFNGWDGAQHAMRRLNAGGIWELFVPGVGAHETYKFQILTNSGEWIDKADPMARHAEKPPHTASVVAAPRGHEWQDAAWMERRAKTNPHEGPMSVYELHALSWKPGLSYRELADELIPYLDETGFTHVEFMPLAEHPYGPSWGYQVTGYFAPTSRMGSPDDLRYLIDRLHGAGYGVIMDWVPGHFPKDAFGLARFDGEPLYEHSDPRLGDQQDWGTYVFNFGDSQVRNFLVGNALYWLEEFHIDGLRVDAVASMLYRDYSRDEWIPNIHGGREYLEAISFLQEANATAYKNYPGVIMIAEESTSFDGVTRPTDQGGLGFGLKWNMGWMNDDLRYIERDPIHRSYHHNDLMFSFVYAWSEQYVLPISHDEVVHGKGSLFGKMPGDHWQKLANVRLFLAYMWGHPGKQLLFMGQEFAQQAEWNESRGLDWWQLDDPAHRGILKLVTRLNTIYREQPALWELDNDPSGLQWISGGDAANSVVVFARRDRAGRSVITAFNFSNQGLHDYRIGVPSAGTWHEALNTDDWAFGGSGVTNVGPRAAQTIPYDGFEQSIAISLPPLGATWWTIEE